MGFKNNKSLAFAVAWMINSLAYSIVYPFIPIYLGQERGIPISTVGLIFPMMGAAVIIAPLFAGHFTDKLGRYRMMQFGQLGRGALFVLLAIMAVFEAPFWAFAVVLMVNAGVGCTFQIASDSYITDCTDPAERPLFYSKMRIGTNVGWAVGPMLGAFLSRTPFALMFAFTALLCGAGAWYIRAYFRQNAEIPQPAAARSRAAARRERRPALGAIFRKPGITLLLTSSFMLFLLLSQLYSVLSIYATQVVGVSKNTLGFVYSVNGLTIVFLQLPFTKIFDRFKVLQIKRAFWGAFLYGTGYFSLAFCTDGFALAVSIFVLTLGEIAVQPALYTMISRIAARDAVGRTMAVLSTVRGIGYAVGPYIGSLVYARYSASPLILWGILSLFALAAMVGYARLFSQRGTYGGAAADLS